MRCLLVKCNACEEEARGVCQFCGRAVCGTHAQTGRFVSGMGTVRHPGTSILVREVFDFVVVDNAIWCGKCSVRPYYSG